MKKRIISFVMAVIMLLGITACSASPESQSSEPRILKMDGSNLGYPSVYTSSTKGRGYLMVSYTFDTLMWKDENGILPLLAKEYTVSEDQKTYTFKLNEGVKFSDGEELTSEDVKFSFEYLSKYPYQWISVDPVASVEAPDRYTVVINLKDVYVPFITDIAGNVPIMPKHIWEGVTEPEKFNGPEAVIGSGPLVLESYDKDTGVYVYNKNPEYFFGNVQIDKLIISEIENTKEALLAGEIDMASDIKYGEAMKLKEQNSEYSVIEGPGLWVGRVYFNFDIDEFNSKEIRQAMYYAINRDEIVKKALKNAAETGNPGHIHPGSQWYNLDIKQYEFSTAKARELLAQAGAVDSDGDGVFEYDGKKMEYEFIVPQEQIGVAEQLTKYLKDAGILLVTKSMDQKSVASAIKDGKFQLALNGHGSFGGDPVLLGGFSSTSSASTPSVTTQGGKQWSNDEFNKIFKNQITEIDEEKRMEDVAKLQQIIAEELPTLTLYYKKTASAYNSEVFDGWFYTKDGVALAVPTVHNKLVFVRGQWNKK